MKERQITLLYENIFIKYTAACKSFQLDRFPAPRFMKYPTEF